MKNIKQKNESGKSSSSKKTVKTISRKKFIKGISVISAGTFIGLYGLQKVISFPNLPNWKSISFPGVILKNFLLFDGIQNNLQEGLKILIKGDKIIDIVREGEISDYKNFQIIDLNGKVLMPGLIDNHVHITVPFMYDVNINSAMQMNTQILLNFRNCVMNGVTTVRDVGGFPEKIIKYRNLSNQNEIPGPRVISSLSPIATRNGKQLGAPEKAPYFTNPIIKWVLGGNFAERPVNIAEIRKATEEILGMGANWLKTLHQEHTVSADGIPLPNHTDKGYRTILAAGKDNGVKSAIHSPLVSGFIKAVDLGFDTTEHMPVDKLIPKKYIEKFNEKSMAIMPTMMIYKDLFKTKEIINLISEKGSQYFVPEALIQMKNRIENIKNKSTRIPSWDSEYMKLNFPIVRQNFENFYKMGAVIGAGSDIGGTMSGFFGRFTDELEHYVESGMSNFDTLKAATSTNAEIIDMQDKIGTVQKGKFADLIVINENPLKDIKALRKVKIVIKGGVFVKYEE